jgi:hypothetical protein
MCSIQPRVEAVPPSTPVEGGDNTAHVVPPPDEDNGDKTEGNDVYIMNTKTEERATSFFAQPGILAGTM